MNFIDAAQKRLAHGFAVLRKRKVNVISRSKKSRQNFIRRGLSYNGYELPTVLWISHNLRGYDRLFISNSAAAFIGLSDIVYRADEEYAIGVSNCSLHKTCEVVAEIQIPLI